jgi:hypothetical protein
MRGITVLLALTMIGAGSLIGTSKPNTHEAIAVAFDTLKRPAQLQLIATVAADSLSTTFPDTLHLTINWTGVAHAKGYRVTVVTGTWDPPGTVVTVGGGTRRLTFHAAQRSDVGHFKTSVVTVAVCAFGPDKVLRDSACNAHRWTLTRPDYLK